MLCNSCALCSRRFGRCQGLPIGPSLGLKSWWRTAHRPVGLPVDLFGFLRCRMLLARMLL